MTDQEFKIISDKIKDTSEAIKGKDIYYKCTLCGSILPSMPKDNVGCKCGNIFIDIDFVRLAIDDYKHFMVVRKMKK
jgi:hypothetical protein